MKTRYIVLGASGLIFVLAVLIIFVTVPSKENISAIAEPTLTPTEKLLGENLEGQVLFSRGGMLWAWRGNNATRMAIEPGKSVVANNQVSLLEPTLAPAANAIAYIRRDESFSDLWLVNADGSNPHSLTSNRGPGIPRSQGFADGSLWAYSPAWSPDGNNLAFLWDKGTDDLTLWVTPAKAFNPRKIATIGTGQGGMARPVWSPDGTRILFTGYENFKPQIWRVNLQSGQIIRLTNTPDGAYDAAYSPDGKYIAYIQRKGSNAELWLMTSDGDNPILVSNLTSRSPVWNPASDKIAFLALKEQSFDLFTINLLNGVPGELKQISKKGNLDGGGGLSWGK